MSLLGSSVAVIAATQHLPVLALQAGRYAITAIAVVAMAAVFRIRIPRPSRREWPWIALGALSGLVGFNLATIVGTRHAEPGLFGAAVACLPIALALVDALVRRRRPSGRILLGALVVSAGAVAVTGWGRGDAIGVALAGCLIVGEVGFTLCGARVLPAIGTWGYSLWSAVAAAVTFGVLSFALERPDLAAFASWEAVGAIAYLGAIATALSFVLWFTAVGRLGSGVAGLCAGIAAPASALVAWGLGAPLPTIGVWLGMALIATGLVVGLAPSPRPAGEAPR